MKERLLADLDVRIGRHAGGDSSGVLDERALALVAELTALGEPDTASLVRVAALHLCRYEALPPEHGAVDLKLALALYTNLHARDPRLVSPEVRALLGLASPHDSGVALMREYERTGRLDQLERAISLFRQEVLEDRADRANSYYSLGMALSRRFERFGQPGDLHEAVELSRGALAAAAPHDPRRADFRAGLADGLLRRFGVTAAPSDVDEAIAVCRAVVADTAGDQDHPKALSHLAVALYRRFERTGSAADLDDAVHASRRAIATIPADHPDFASHQANLGTALRARYERDGQPADLDAAVLLGRAALAATPADHPIYAGRAAFLGATLKLRFERTGQRSDLDAAIALGVS